MTAPVVHPVTPHSVFKKDNYSLYSDAQLERTQSGILLEMKRMQDLADAVAAELNIRSK